MQKNNLLFETEKDQTPPRPNFPLDAVVSKPLLMCGDCLELMQLCIADGSIDLTVTSPPYDNLRTYNGNIAQWNEEKWKGIIRELYRVTPLGGVVVWDIS